MEIINSEKFVSELSFEAQHRTKQSLERTTHGFPTDLVTPLLPDRDDPTGGRIRRIAEFERAALSHDLIWLRDAEIDKREKIGPYSIMLPYLERREQIEDYFRDVKFSPDRRSLQLAKDALRKEVRGKLTAVSKDVAFDQLPRNTNLGFPWLSKEKEDLAEVLAKVDEVEKAGWRIEDATRWPAMLYWRGQPRGLDEVPKQRTVWGYSKINTVPELMIQISLLGYLQGVAGYSAWVSPDAVDLEVTELIDRAHGVSILSSDATHFDQTAKPHLTCEVFDCMRDWFIRDNWPLIDYVERALHYIPLMTPEGIWIGEHGIGSGSGVTNLIGTLTTRLAYHYASFRMNNPIVRLLAQGDDAVALFMYPISVDELSGAMAELGLEISSDKGGFDLDTVVYLQNLHNRHYRLKGICRRVRPLYKVLNGALSYERFHAEGTWSPPDDTLRWIMQFEAAKFHPGFPIAVHLLYSWDAYLQKYTIRQLIRKAGGMGKVKSVLIEKGFPYGKENISGLQSFKTVQLIQKIRGLYPHQQ